LRLLQITAIISDTNLGKLVRLMKILSVEEIKTHLSQGTPDDELMRAYGLSPDELECLYERLIKAVADGSLFVRMGKETN
jgi:hypothetical protein